MPVRRMRRDGFLSVHAVGVVAGLAAILSVVNVFLARSNAQIEAEARRRQQVIDQAVALSPLNAQLSELIGSLVQTTGDIDMRAVLESHGVTIKSDIGGVSQ